jgi:hypothetical protein
MLIIPVYSSIRLKVTYNSCKTKKSIRGLTGYDVAKKILDANGLTSLYIVETNGTMTDAYDSSRKVLRLSKEVYKGDSLASIAIAAHECGHAVQDAQGYAWFKRRHAFAPVASLGSKFSYIIFIVGLILGLIDLIYVGIILMGFGLLFEIITLPCELDASKRGIAFLKEYALVEDSEVPQTKKMLKAAAFTYIAAIVTTLLEMLYYLMRYSRRD